jgi:hypothetical protein
MTLGLKPPVSDADVAYKRNGDGRKRRKKKKFWAKNPCLTVSPAG